MQQPDSKCLFRFICKGAQFTPRSQQQHQRRSIAEQIPVSAVAHRVTAIAEMTAAT
jgi:hypothetical protein